MSLFGPSDGNRPASAEDDMLQKGDDGGLLQELLQDLCVKERSRSSSLILTSLSVDSHSVSLQLARMCATQRTTWKSSKNFLLNMMLTSQGHLTS
jgi:hypothetical protein